jgi:hypothetical protein
MGAARFYVLGAAFLLVLLALIGFMHLFSPKAAPVVSKAPAPQRSPAPAPPAVADEPMLVVTEVGAREMRGRYGQLNVAVRIGVAPRPHLKKGEVEIRVLFFDVTPSGEMRPTDAKVDYEWITPVRDWSDPRPKYLVATYLGEPEMARRPAGLRYGGFLVRVFFDGQLQAEKSEPKSLVALLHQATPTASASKRQADLSSAAVSVAPVEPRVAQRVPSVSPAPTTQVGPTLASSPANRQTSSAIPYASPVPNKPGFVYSPYDPKFLIDVRGFPPGTEVTDPNTSKPFKVP